MRLSKAGRIRHGEHWKRRAHAPRPYRREWPRRPREPGVQVCVAYATPDCIGKNSDAPLRTHAESYLDMSVSVRLQLVCRPVPGIRRFLLHGCSELLLRSPETLPQRRDLSVAPHAQE